MAKAYARWVNAQGGIDGRKLTVLTCNERNDAGGRRAAAPGGRSRRRPSRSSAPTASTADAFLPPLEAAGIPYIGGYGVTNEEFTSSLSYPVNGGQPALLAGLGTQLAEQLRPRLPGPARHHRGRRSCPRCSTRV